MNSPPANEGLLNSRAEQRWFRRSALALLAFFVIVRLLLARLQQHAKTVQRDEHRLQLDSTANDPGVTAAETVDTSKALRVVVGIYLDRVTELSIKEARWTPIFDVWFRWRGNRISPVDKLVVLEGEIASREKLAEVHEGDDHYERYRIAATLTKKFSITHFPLDEQLLLISMENGNLPRQNLLFVPDLENSNVSSRVQLQGYGWSKWSLIEKPHSYKSNLGDPRIDPRARSTFSQIRFGLPINRSGWGLYFKMFNSLYVAVAISFIACFIKPINVDPRFGLGVGALFAAVANSYVVQSYVPDTGDLALADIINCLGILTGLLKKSSLASSDSA